MSDTKELHNDDICETCTHIKHSTLAGGYCAKKHMFVMYNQQCHHYEDA